ncbi:undecaprenyl-diphosphatase [Dokdonella fugitiva]|uniref:undecaprenyl-diphosphate phosphatase n=1 Tax=Dokdonella fugitiva TaxID=328517 RepID=A0A839EW86_9GAMM|nr:phosphatase PAP2 family protein [Dokdonella fugitiva]MBA8886042.1 undecaprenyl-diphosphatase [Dokdonella fugitiva]
MTTWQRIEIGSGERRLCLAMNRWGARRALIRLFRLVSRLGDGAFWYALMLVLALFAGRRGLQAALHMACVGIVAALLYRTLKRWTRRPRPFRTHADITPYIAPLDEFSFPSGHTLHAVSFTLIALAYFPWLAPLLLPFTLLVAMSRVVLGLHYPSDVLAATVIACALAGSSLWLIG